MNNIIHVLLHSDLSNQEQREKVFQVVLHLADNALAPHVMKLDTEVVNPVILLDVLTHFQEDLSRIAEPNEFRVGGYLCFWIRKLKPFRRISRFNLFTNEYIGLLIGLAIVCTQNPVKEKGSSLDF